MPAKDVSDPAPSSAIVHRRGQINFEQSKCQCLGKRDKSFAGRIDPRAIKICSVINQREEYYTTSSCAGRCFLYQGAGVKATTNFRRWRLSHEKVGESQRYFDLSTLDSDPSGGGDPIRSVGQFEHAKKLRQLQEIGENPLFDPSIVANISLSEKQHPEESSSEPSDSTIWLRFEPFILHVACRSMSAASALMTVARPTFKNVGLTTWKDSNANSSFAKYLVAIWGDEGLDMPLTTPDGFHPFAEHHIWLAELVNSRHQRNWEKIERFVEAVRKMPESVEEEEDEEDENHGVESSGSELKVPKHFDMIGDIAVLNYVPLGNVEERRRIGEALMRKNKAIKLVVARQLSLEGTERAPGLTGFLTLAGAVARSPLMTTHSEYGIKCVVDLNHTFFSPRMGPERLRICQQVARGENVLVLFAGVGMEALQIAGRTEATSILAVEKNPIAIRCMQRSHQLLERNPNVKCIGADKRLKIIEGDVLQVIPNQLPKDHFDRILAPRPKEGSMDGDLGTGDGGVAFLEALLPAMKQNGGECHWYDFAADHELPECARTHRLLERTCNKSGLNMEILHVANAGSVAMRQFRVCVDFRISKI